MLLLLVQGSYFKLNGLSGSKLNGLKKLFLKPQWYMVKYIIEIH